MQHRSVDSQAIHSLELNWHGPIGLACRVARWVVGGFPCPRTHARTQAQTLDVHMSQPGNRRTRACTYCLTAPACAAVARLFVHMGARMFAALMSAHAVCASVCVCNRANYVDGPRQGPRPQRRACIRQCVGLTVVIDDRVS